VGGSGGGSRKDCHAQNLSAGKPATESHMAVIYKKSGRDVQPQPGTIVRYSNSKIRNMEHQVDSVKYDHSVLITDNATRRVLETQRTSARSDTLQLDSITAAFANAKNS
jgi:hypothetical protein